MTKNARPTRVIAVIVALIAVSGGACVRAQQQPDSADLNDRTVWSFEPSVAYDALSFINGLSGDPFYAPYYGNSVRRFDARLSDPARRSFARLARRKQRYGFIYSAFTTMLASTASPSDMKELADYFSRPGEVMRAYRRTEYYRPIHGALFRFGVARDSVRVVRGLDKAGFEAYWRERKLPLIEERIAELREASATWDIVPEIERRLGEPVDGESVQVYVLAFGQPHAVKLAGNRLLVDLSYSDEIIAQNAIHELMHPPVDWSEPDMRALVDRLEASPLVRRSFDGRDPAFGYNQFQGYIEESIVRVLEQRIAEGLGLASRAGEDRWRHDDGGMHVFAAVLYALTDEEGYMASDEPIDEFLVRHFVDGDVTEERLVALWERGTDAHGGDE